MSDIVDLLGLGEDRPGRPGRRAARNARATVGDRTPEELEQALVDLETEMFAAAEELRFEQAASLRDQIAAVRRELDARAVRGAGRAGQQAVLPAGPLRRGGGRTRR